MVSLKKYDNTLKYPAYKRINTNFGYFLRKIVKDNELDDSLKAECLENICSLTCSSDIELKENCIAYFNDNKLKGSVCSDIDKLNPFVRIHTKDAFIGWITEIVRLKPESVKDKLTHILYAGSKTDKKMLLENFLNIPATGSSYLTKEKCEKYFGVREWKGSFPPKLKDARVSNFNFIQWSFTMPLKEDIFVNQVAIETLPCRSGLMDSNKKIIFIHNINDSFNVRRPTVLDAGFYEQFEPGGKTKPLTRCSHLTGFDEFVHKPNKFSNMQGDFYETFNP